MIDNPGAPRRAVYQGCEAHACSGDPHQHLQGAGRVGQGPRNVAARPDRDEGRGRRAAARQPELHICGGGGRLWRISKQRAQHRGEEASISKSGRELKLQDEQGPGRPVQNDWRSEQRSTRFLQIKAI